MRACTRTHTHTHTHNTHAHAVTLFVAYISDTLRYEDQCVILFSFCNSEVVVNEFSVSLKLTTQNLHLFTQEVPDTRQLPTLYISTDFITTTA